MPETLDIARLKSMAMATWRRGGMDTLVKVMPKGTVPAQGHMSGYCTTFKYVVGRTPAEMEAVLGLAPGTKLARGAEIFLVRPLPTAAQFDRCRRGLCGNGLSSASPVG